MTLRRATLYVGGASLLIAWFSSAASLSLARNPQRGASAGPEVTSPADGVAGTVHAQVRRLKERLAASPLPQQPLRNPFVFRDAPSSVSPARPRGIEPMSAAAIAQPAPSEPILALAGMAEQRTSKGVVRTAVITSDGVDVIMVVVGASVLGRYTVTAIGVDAVELTDVSTGRTRRLALQDH